MGQKTFDIVLFLLVKSLQIREDLGKVTMRLFKYSSIHLMENLSVLGLVFPMLRGNSVAIHHKY